MSKTNNVARIAFILHSWLGITSGIFLLLLGLSGSALVFLKEIDHVFNPELVRAEPGPTVISLDSIYRNIGKDYPNLSGIAWLNPDAPPNEAYEFRLYQNDGRISTYDLGIINIDPYSGKILRAGDLKDINTGLMNWILQFHWSFQLGVPGLLLATVFGITVLFSIISGIIIYRRYVWKVLFFKVRIKWDNWRTIASSLHRIIGVWTLLVNLVIFFTGFWMNRFSLDPGYWKKQTISNPNNTLSLQPVDSMLHIVKKTMPELNIKNIYLPTQPGKSFRVRGTIDSQSPVFHTANSVAIDPVTGRVVSVERFADKSFWEKVEATFFPLHSGSYGGVFIKSVYVVLGLIPGFLSISGALLWWRRLKRR